MSERKDNVQQDVLNVRYFAERMLRAMYAEDQRGQEETLFELARYAAARFHLQVLHVFTLIVSIWNGETAAMRSELQSAGETRRTVFRIIGEVFGKYGLPAGEYEEDEL